MKTTKIIQETFLMLFIPLAGLCQTQMGFVKTAGSYNEKGKQLSGVTIRVKGEHNAVLSKKDGTFGIKIQGQDYALQQIQKQGYELKDLGIIGRRYAYSKTVPLTIVMISSKQLQANKQRIEENAFKTAERNYKIKLASLEKQKEQNEITIEQYRQKILDLQERFEKYQSLIEPLADHYARTDYDELDVTEQEINQCIENGELERAEILLQQTGFLKRINEIELLKAFSQKKYEETIILKEDVLRQQERDALHCYQAYTSKLLQFDRDSAKYYIELRAELDTTNVEWQLDAAEFESEYLSDFKKAQFYNELALRHAEPGSNSIAKCLISMGDVFYYQGKYAYARKLYIDAQKIKENLFGETSQNLAEIFIRLGNIASAISKWDQSDALRYYQHALEICNSTLGDKDPEILATCHYCIGLCYFALSELHSVNNSSLAKKEKQKSYESLIQAKVLYTKKFGSIHTYIAHCDKALGDYYHYQRNFDKAIEYDLNAMDIWKKIFGEYHPKVADSYYALGAVYGSMDNYETCLKYYRQALAIRSVILGEEHPSTMTVKESIKSVESRVKRKQDSFDFSPLFDSLEEALDKLKF